MTIKHLKIFIEVAHYESITKAAEELYMTQPAVSLAISQLEENYNVKLFERINQRIKITEDGRILLQFAKNVISQFNDFESSANNSSTYGNITIGSSISIGITSLPQMIEEFTSIHPELNIKVEVSTTEQIIDMLNNSTIDIGFIEGPYSNYDFVCTTFKNDRLALVCGNNYIDKDKLKLSELTNYKFLLRDQTSGTRKTFDSIMIANGIKINPTWQSISTLAIIKAAIHNQGIAVVPYELVKNSLNNNECREITIENCDFNRQLSVIYHKNKFMSKKIKLFLDYIETYKRSH